MAMLLKPLLHNFERAPVLPTTSLSMRIFSVEVVPTRWRNNNWLFDPVWFEISDRAQLADDEMEGG